MKIKIVDEIKSTVEVLRRYASVNLEYIKLTAAEKFTMMVSGCAVAVAAMVCAGFMLVFLGFSCVELFKLIMHPALAYLSTAGVFLLLFVLVLAFKRPLILNPLARFITSILFDPRTKNK